MRCFRFLVVVAVIAGISVCAQAKIGTCDTVPAATLLLPYFEVDLGQWSSTGITTILFVNNASTSSVIAQVSLWTDYGVPTTAFDITLAGNSVLPLNLRDIFSGLTIAGVDFSARTAELIPAHTGLPSPATGKVSGKHHGDEIARGYVLVNAMNQAGAGFPTEAGYFVSGGNGKASNQNVLWGDYMYLDPTNNFSQGDTLVHIEASSTDPLVATNGAYTFYGAFVNATAADNREPLGTSWAVSFDIDDSYHPTDFVYWRDSKVVMSPINPWLTPSWFPLVQEQCVVYNEAGTPYNPLNVAPLPLVCGRLDVANSDQVASPYERGWILLNLNSTPSGPVFGTTRQSWLSSVKSWEGRFSTGQSATLLVHASSVTKASGTDKSVEKD